MDSSVKTIAKRLNDLGYGYCRDDLTDKDGRRMILVHGIDGWSVDRLNVEEAAEFCSKLEGLK